MRTFVTAAALLGTVLVAFPATQASRDGRPSDSLTRPFQANGTITMDLSAGEYRIEGSPDAAIRVTWSARDRRRLERVRTRVEVRGREAEIEIKGPGRNNNGDDFEVSIQVPTRSDLEVRLSAGELDVRRVTGNKDVRLQAGEPTIDVGRPDDYRRVEASVWAGEVQASPFGRTTGGLFRSIDWQGPGQYRLEAHLKAGEIRLR
jgi:hypothetical protein